MSRDERLPAALSPVVAAMTTDSAALLTDARTGLPNARWMLPFLAGRVAAARRTLRPVSCAVASVGPAPRVALSPSGVAWVAALLSATFRECDTVGALDADRFIVVMEDTAAPQACAALRRLERELEGTPASLWAGVAAYPEHGDDEDEVLASASLAHHRALDEPQGAIAGATS